jgi:hypothetical protein
MPAVPLPLTNASSSLAATSSTIRSRSAGVERHDGGPGQLVGEAGDRLEALRAVEQDDLTEVGLHLGDQLVLAVPGGGAHADELGDADDARGGDVEDARAGGQEHRRLLQRLDEDALDLLLSEFRTVDGREGHEGSRG